MKQLKIGIIGLSEGNGHPYSWSAIINGYDQKYMKDCPFPVIPEYLSKQKFPEDSIPGANVTHIWTQYPETSLHIAKAAKINDIVEKYTDLTNKVDAILLARDDYELHYEMSVPFIKAGLPVYIDKPIATTVSEAKKIFSLQRYEGQIFTCSAIQYAKEFSLTQKQRENIGKIKYVDACVKGPWDKYSIHIIEPVLKIIGDQGEIKEVKENSAGENIALSVLWESGLITNFITLNKAESPLTIRIFGENNFAELIFNDAFNAFKSALREFIDICTKKKTNNIRNFTLKAISIVEKGINK